jgi:hypothetical protein
MAGGLASPSQPIPDGAPPKANVSQGQVLVSDDNLQILATKPFLKWEKHAYCNADLVLLDRVGRMVGETPYEEFGRIFLRMMKMLHLCDYTTSDLVCVLAHATAYYERAPDVCKGMGRLEKANVITILCFIAHSFVLDECCPLKIWHQYLFRKYCDLKTLNDAVVRLLTLMGWKLRVADAESRHAYLLHEQNPLCGSSPDPGASSQ